MDLRRIIVLPVALFLLASSLPGCQHPLCRPHPEALWADYCFPSCFGGMGMGGCGSSCSSCRMAQRPSCDQCSQGGCNTQQPVAEQDIPIPVPHPLVPEPAAPLDTRYENDYESGTSPKIVEVEIGPVDPPAPGELTPDEDADIVPIVPRNVIPRELRP